MKSLWVFILVFSLSFSSNGYSQEHTGDTSGDEVYDEISVVEIRTTHKGKNKIPQERNIGFGPIKEMIISTRIDDKKVRSGRDIFRNSCATCHKIHKDFIGPKLSGVTDIRTPEWVMNKMLAPLAMKERDSISRVLREEYGSFMPNIEINMEEAREVYEYLRTL